jgi:lysophospholipase L1-like esterase
VTNLNVNPSTIAKGITYLLDTLTQFNPEAMVIYSGMIIRPKDLGTTLERRRRLVNDMVYRHCQANGIHFLKSWKCLMRGSDLRPHVYARDGLHLSRLGARYLYKFLEGNMRTVEGLMKL